MVGRLFWRLQRHHKAAVDPDDARRRLLCSQLPCIIALLGMALLAASCEPQESAPAITGAPTAGNSARLLDAVQLAAALRAPLSAGQQVDRQAWAAQWSGALAPTGAGSAVRVRWALLQGALDRGAPASRFVDASTAVFDYLDPVWGGLLEQHPPYWSSGAPAQALATQLDTQSLALQLFAQAQQRTGEQRFQNALERIDGYLQDWLRDAQGHYALGQRLRPPTVTAAIGLTEYWQLRRAHDRRQLGVPGRAGPAGPASRAQLALAYLQLHAATIEANYLAEALQLADALFAEWRDVAAAPLSAAACQDGPLLLRLALQAYQSSADERWLAAGQSLAARLLSQRRLQPRCAVASVGGAALADMSLAAALQTLGVLTGQLRWTELMEPLIDSALLQGDQAGIAVQLTLATQLLTLRGGFTAVRVAGERRDPRTQALHSAVLRTWAAAKVIVPVSPAQAAAQRLPEIPAAYVCGPRACGLPLLQADAVIAAIASRQSAQPLPIHQQLQHYLGATQANAAPPSHRAQEPPL